MMEKVLLALFLLSCSIVGYLVREMLSEIKGTQKEHSLTLTNIRQHVFKVEDKQSTLSVEISKLRETVTASAVAQRDAKTIIDHSLYEMRQQLKVQTDEQFEQKQNFGKVFLIVQKLYAATKNGARK